MNYTKTNLETFISNNKGKFKESHVIKIMAKLLRSIEFIHSAGVMHRDIKPSNILINKDFEVLICDFGLARTTLFKNSLTFDTNNGRKKDKDEISRALRHDKQDRRRRERRLSQHVQTRFYRAPEVILLEKEYS